MANFSRNYPNSKLSGVLFNQILDKWIGFGGNSYVDIYGSLESETK